METAADLHQNHAASEPHANATNANAKFILVPQVRARPQIVGAQITRQARPVHREPGSLAILGSFAVVRLRPNPLTRHPWVYSWVVQRQFSRPVSDNCGVRMRLKAQA